MHFGIMTEMKSFAHGVFMCMVALTVTRGSLSIWSAARTSQPPQWLACLLMQLACLGGPVELEGTLGQKIMRWSDFSLNIGAARTGLISGGGEITQILFCSLVLIIPSHRSLHNIRMERGWRDIRKDSLESFRQIFQYLVESHLLDMDNFVHKTCLFLVFQGRIQQSLNRTRDAWNHHKMRTERHKTPLAMYELSRELAIQRGYWTGDAGDDIETAADPEYGLDGHAPLPPTDEQTGDPAAPREEPVGRDAQREAGIFVNDEDDLDEVREQMGDFDFEEDDGNWGIDVYCRAVILLISLR